MPRKVRLKRKKRGAPRWGLLHVSPARFREIPVECGAQRLSDVLGVRVQTIYRWCSDGLPCAVIEGRASFAREGVQQWLLDTGRHRPRREY